MTRSTKWPSGGNQSCVIVFKDFLERIHTCYYKPSKLPVVGKVMDFWGRKGLEREKMEELSGCVSMHSV